LKNIIPSQTDNRLLRLVLPIVAVIILQATLAFSSLEVLSAVRAYVGGEGLWSKGQKDSIHYITLYAMTGDGQYFRKFQSAIAIPLADRSARLALELETVDLVAARKGFSGGGNHTDDISSMIWLFRYFRNISYMATAVDIWRKTDPFLVELVSLGNAIHEDFSSGSGAAVLNVTRKDQIERIDRGLAPLAIEFSRSLGAGSRDIKALLTIVNLLAAVALIVLIVLQKRISLKYQLKFENALRITNTRFDAALKNLPQGICMFDGQKQLAVWNGRFAEIYQLPPDLLRVGTPHEAIIADRISRGILKGETSESAVETKLAALDQIPADTGSSRVDELADGRLMRIVRQPMADGGWVATHEDITEQRRAEAEIAHLACHDVLTGLANRAEFNARLAEATGRLLRNGRAVTVMMLDLDKFKAVNDGLGHPAGDELLVEVGRRLKSSIRAGDVLARLGGDEFAIIQEGVANQHEDAISLALRIIGVIAEPFDLGGHQASIGASIGIALSPEHGVKPAQLIKCADLALYDAKANGRNDYRIFQAEMLEAVQTQRLAESELREAINRGELELHYQPVVDIKTRRLNGVEALVRWRHPTRGLVSPDQFIPLAESTGLIVPLGHWVLQRACTDAASWPEHIKVAVNISAVQIKKSNLFDVILCVLLESGLAAERLELEITETTLLESRETHLATIRQLKNLGISIALDDFGTGFSSVNYLTTFPFDKIKIDKSFTQGVFHRRECKAVIASTLALAQGLGTVTTAEGIETEEQLAYMRDAGVDLVQGYLLGKPVPASKLDLSSAARPAEMVA
jgi:diguanylate cyclase (GGDEF)-like protein